MNPVNAEAPQQTVTPLVNPVGGSTANPAGITDWYVVFGYILKYSMGILGSAALVVFLYGGFLWLTSRGNSDKVKEGLDAMLYAGIGLFIIFGSYAILSVVFSGLTK